MKIKLFFVIAIIMLLAACEINNEDITEKDKKINEINDTTEKIIDLAFEPVARVALKEGAPGKDWIIGQSIYFGALPNQIESTVHLYINGNEDTDRKPGEGIIYGFLEHNNKLYELGEVSSYGFNDVNVSLADRTFDGIKEINIIGGMGATYAEMKVIAYNENSNEWENILTMGSPRVADLDMDGYEELVAHSAGSLPPYVDIYRWSNNCFERAEITESTGNLYALLDTINGEWIIKTGLQDSEPDLYKYEAGRLIEYKQE